MKISMWGRLLALSFIWAMAGTIPGADRHITFPAGWATDPWTSPKASAPGVVGVVLTDDNPLDGSRLMQIRGTNVRSTSIPGRVVYVLFAPDGDKAVLSAVLPTQGPTVYVVDAEGNVLWQRADTNVYSFSASGTHLMAWRAGFEGPPPTNCAIYNLNGALVRSVSWEKPVADALLLDSRTVLLGMGHSVLAYDSESGQTAWRHDLTVQEPRILQLSSFRPGQVLVTLELGGFKLLSSQTGAVIYSYHPWALATGQPQSVHKFYSSYRPYPGPDGDILLFNGGGNAMRVNPAQGNISSLQLPAGGPPDYRLNDAVFDNHLVFLSRSGVLLRPIQ